MTTAAEDLGAFDFEQGDATVSAPEHFAPLPGEVGGPPAPIPAADLHKQPSAAGTPAPPVGGYSDAAANPGVANRAAALASQSDDNPLMQAEAEPVAHLLVGLLDDDHVYIEAVVREMNGNDEEAMSKSLVAGNVTRLIDVVVHRAVESIGPLTGTTLDKHLDSLLVGDRDLLVLAARRATFGDTLKFEGVECPHCNERMEVTYDLRTQANGGDVPVKTVDDCPGIDDISKRTFEVMLPSGKVADVRLLDGTAQKAIFTPDNEQKNPGELNTLLMSEVVTAINKRPVRGITAIRDLSMRDRHVLSTFILDNQPGPKYEEVVQECVECKGSFPFIVNVLDFFRYV